MERERERGMYVCMYVYVWIGEVGSVVLSCVWETRFWGGGGLKAQKRKRIEERLD